VTRAATGTTPTRAAVILPWAHEAGSGAGRAGEQGRAVGARVAEARLVEAVGLAASIGLVVVHTAILPLRARRPATLLGTGIS